MCRRGRFPLLTQFSRVLGTSLYFACYGCCQRGAGVFAGRCGRSVLAVCICEGKDGHEVATRSMVILGDSGPHRVPCLRGICRVRSRRENMTGQMEIPSMFMRCFLNCLLIRILVHILHDYQHVFLLLAFASSSTSSLSSLLRSISNHHFVVIIILIVTVNFRHNFDRGL